MHEQIGLPNLQGDVVLQPKPRQIQIDHPTLDQKVVLDLWTGQAYTIMYGINKGEVVRAGDYVGADGHYRSHRWVLTHREQWERVG